MHRKELSEPEPNLSQKRRRKINKSEKIFGNLKESDPCCGSFEASKRGARGVLTYHLSRLTHRNMKVFGMKQEVWEIFELNIFCKTFNLSQHHRRWFVRGKRNRFWSLPVSAAIRHKDVTSRSASSAQRLGWEFSSRCRWAAFGQASSDSVIKLKAWC